MRFAGHSAAYQAAIDRLQSAPFDGREVNMSERRGVWRYAGVSGVCERRLENRMLVVVQHDPDGYWPVGAEVIVEVDADSVPIFGEVVS